MNRPISSRINLAIVMTDTLRRLGLEYLLRSVADKCLIDSYDSFDIFLASDVDRYHIAFMEDSIAMLHSDFFRGRKIRLVPIYTNPIDPNAYDESLSGVCTFSDRTEIRTALLNSIKKRNLESALSASKDLSQRELEVLKEVAIGKTNKEIADSLDISMNTVMTHRKNITSKLGIKTVSGLTFYALMNGILSAGDVKQAVERDMN